jgi:hypothetical protein
VAYASTIRVSSLRSVSPTTFQVGHAGLDWKQPGLPEEREYVEAYRRRLARDGITDPDFYVGFSMFRVAAILQGFWGRLHRGYAFSANSEAVPSTLGRVVALP